MRQKRCIYAFVLRLLVSASQDGKLIIWDSYTTNKVMYRGYLLLVSEAFV